MWDLTGSGTEPVSPALASRFFTTEPPGKPWETYCSSKASTTSQTHLHSKIEHFKKKKKEEEMRLRTGHGIMDWFQFGKALCQDCILSHCLLTYMQCTSCRNPCLGTFLGELHYSGLENSIDGIVCGAAESDITEQLSVSFFTFHHAKWWAGRRTDWNQDAERNIKYLRYRDDTIQRTESKETLRSPLKKLKEASENLASTQDWKNQDHGIWSHHFMANRYTNNGNSDRLNFGGFQKYCRLWLQPWN